MANEVMRWGNMVGISGYYCMVEVHYDASSCSERLSQQIVWGLVLDSTLRTAAWSVAPYHL